MQRAPFSLTFLGGTGTVTGSKYLLDYPHGGPHGDGRSQTLVDCGLFQGFKQLRLRNWAPLPLAPAAIESVVLTHAHLDHSGALPLLVRSGYRGRVYCTRSTADLCKILLPDSGHLQELDAAYANRKGFSRHHPALPLYTVEDAEHALHHLRPVDFGAPFDLPGGLVATFSRAGHILGAASLHLTGDGLPSLVFSGDLGRQHDLMMNPPDPRPAADYVVIESTYGDRRHGAEDPGEVLADIVRRTVARGGTVLIPAFAVGRTQALLVLLHRLREAGKIPAVPVYIDSPMAIAATELYEDNGRDHRLTPEATRAAMRVATCVETAEASKALDRRESPAILLSASGMATGGRVVHHLKHFLPDARHTVLLAGFQAAGTRGAALVGGATQLKIHGAYVPVRAEVAHLDLLSAHADREELLTWLASGPPPRRVFITHGEPAAADALRLAVQERLRWDCAVPDYRDTVTLD